MVDFNTYIVYEVVLFALNLINLLLNFLYLDGSSFQSERGFYKVVSCLIIYLTYFPNLQVALNKVLCLVFAQIISDNR